MSYNDESREVAEATQDLINGFLSKGVMPGAILGGLGIGYASLVKATPSIEKREDAEHMYELFAAFGLDLWDSLDVRGKLKN